MRIDKVSTKLKPSHPPKASRNVEPIFQPSCEIDVTTLFDTHALSMIQTTKTHFEDLHKTFESYRDKLSAIDDKKSTLKSEFLKVREEIEELKLTPPVRSFHIMKNSKKAEHTDNQIDLITTRIDKLKNEMEEIKGFLRKIVTKKTASNKQCNNDSTFVGQQTTSSQNKFYKSTSNESLSKKDAMKDLNYEQGSKKFNQIQNLKDQTTAHVNVQEWVTKLKQEIQMVEDTDSLSSTNNAFRSSKLRASTAESDVQNTNTSVGISVPNTSDRMIY